MVNLEEDIKNKVDKEEADPLKEIGNVREGQKQGKEQWKNIEVVIILKQEYNKQGNINTENLIKINDVIERKSKEKKVERTRRDRRYNMVILRI